MGKIRELGPESSEYALDPGFDSTASGQAWLHHEFTELARIVATNPAICLFSNPIAPS